MIFEIVKTGLLCAAGLIATAGAFLFYVAYVINREDPDNEEYP